MRLAIEHELNSALQNSEFWMVYQPQIKADGSLHGVEALIRWENEKLGFVPPDKFISVAEEMGLMDSIGDFIIDRSLQEIKAIKDELDISFSVSINISVKQMMESDFLEKLLAKIERYRCVKKEITLEITESLFIEDMEYILPILAEVKHTG
ncbi:MAG: EAL domain-containing protein, partial [Epsilonproteobacteria bacterium]|nr:EAL domain-containing protein [Campylobacterota bacterium]